MECINSHKMKKKKQQQLVKVYKARPGAPFKVDEAQVLGEAIEEIKNRCGGEMKISVALREAKNESNPLHDHLEWDDSRCGVEYRTSQLRNITNHIVEEVIVDGAKTNQRSFLSITNSEGDDVYVSRQDAIEVVDYRKQLLDRMIATMDNLIITMKTFRDIDK